MFYFLEVLPPVCFGGRVVQIGEPTDHQGPDGSPRFSTVVKQVGSWYYVGPQPNASKFGIPKVPQSPEVQKLIEGAALASEMIDEDELERYAEEQRNKGGE